MKSDQEILQMIASDQHFDQGFRHLVSQNQERLYWNIRRLVHLHEDADDVLQNVFIKVFKNIKGFKGDSKIYTWLYRISTNEALSFLKKKKRNSTDDDLSVFEVLKTDVYFDGDEAILHLKEAIELLPEKQRTVFNMRYYDELSYKDISEILETSVGSLKASYHHAAKKVENYLKENISHV